MALFDSGDDSVFPTTPFAPSASPLPPPLKNVLGAAPIPGANNQFAQMISPNTPGLPRGAVAWNPATGAALYPAKIGAPQASAADVARDNAAGSKWLAGQEAAQPAASPVIAAQPAPAPDV